MVRIVTARFIVGDTRDVTASLPDASVDLILTSPPFLALRSYLPADHPDKSKEIGSESNPAAFIDVLLKLSAEWRRILAPHGSIVIELGDTYSGSGGAGGDYGENGWREGQPKFRHTNSDRRPGWPLAKSLALVPELYRVALAYGLNPLTGAPSPAGRWRVRNVVRWVRPNPPVGALGDKFRPATSDLVVACVAGDRFFDLDAVRTEAQPGHYGTTGRDGKDRSGNGFRGVTRGSTAYPRTDSNPAGAPPLDWWQIADPANEERQRLIAAVQHALAILDGDNDDDRFRAATSDLVVACVAGDRYFDLDAVRTELASESLRHEGHSRAGGTKFRGTPGDGISGGKETGNARYEISRSNPAGAPPLDWWQIVPGGYHGAHYAVWPKELCERPIEAMCPRRVCVTCGKPSRRIVETKEWERRPHPLEEVGINAGGLGTPRHGDRSAENTTVSWSTCGHPDPAGMRLDGYHCDNTGWRRGLVFDPFAGSGTTLVVAHGHSRDSIGADLDPRNAQLAAERLGMFLTIQTNNPKDTTNGIPA